MWFGEKKYCYSITLRVLITYQFVHSQHSSPTSSKEKLLFPPKYATMRIFTKIKEEEETEKTKSIVMIMIIGKVAFSFFRIRTNSHTNAGASLFVSYVSRK